MQCQSASLCADSQFCTVLVAVCRADLTSHVQCWTLESVVASAHPACKEYGEALAYVSVHYIMRSHAWMPPMYYHCSFEIVYKATTIARTAWQATEWHTMYRSSAQPDRVPCWLPHVTMQIRACLLAA